MSVSCWDVTALRASDWSSLQTWITLTTLTINLLRLQPIKSTWV
jgi:uncharacterized protein (DUF983 family)